MSDDVLITPASRKVEFFDSGGNIDGKIELSTAGDLNITSTGKITIGDITQDIHIGDGTQAVDLVFDFASSIYSVANQDLTIGKGSLGGNDVTIDGASAVLLSLAGTEQARLTSTGLGLGVTAPTDTLAVDGGIKIGEFNSTDTGLYADGAPSSHTSATGASDPQIRVAGRTYDQPGIIQMAFFDQNNFFGGTGRFTLGRLQYAMNENSNTVTTVAEIRGVTDDGTQSTDQQTAGNFDGALTFWTSQGDGTSANLTEKMILTGDGYLGIGTSSPDTALEIMNGSLKITREETESSVVTEDDVSLSVASGLKWTFSQSFDDPNPVPIGTTTDNDVRIIRYNQTHQYFYWDRTYFAKKVGIGTTTVDAPLHVQSASDLLSIFESTDANAGIQIDSPDDGYSVVFFAEGGTNKWSLGKLANNSDKFSIYDEVNTTPRLVIDTDGDVGIGNTSPGTKLDVKGDISAKDTGQSGGVGLHLQNSEGQFFLYTDGGHLVVKDFAGSATYPFKIEGTAQNDTLVVNTGGDVTIKDQLTLGSEIIHSGDTDNKITFGTDTQSFQTGATARMNINNSGLQVGTGARVTTILDEDAMGSDSATALATQQSIKAYVDANAGPSLANDTNNRVVTATGSGGLNGEANLTFSGTVLAVTGQLTATTSSIGSYHIVQAANFVTRDGVAIGSGTTAMTSEGATHRFSSAHSLVGTLLHGSDVELFRVNVTNTGYRKIQGGKMYIRIQDEATGGFFQETVTFAYTGHGTTPVIYSSTDRLDSQMAGSQSSYDHEKATILVEFVTDHIRVKFSNDTGADIATAGWDARVTCTLFEMEALSL